MKLLGAIFDLDGVLVDTARYHYQAWRQIAARLGFVFTEKDNERLKGVSRMDSLRILLEVGNIEADEETCRQLAEEKNALYTGLLEQLDESVLLPGALVYLHRLRDIGVKRALGSGSQNARFILEKLHLTHMFDAIVDGSAIQKPKPDPEIFQKAAAALHLPTAACVVFEDAQAGIAAAHAAGCAVVAVGSDQVLKGADRFVSSLEALVHEDWRDIGESSNE